MTAFPAREQTTPPTPGPVTRAERITALDTIRGVAILATLGWLLDGVDLTRTMIALWILGVWGLPLWWSSWWLKRFYYGPFEWAWRCGRYRSLQPLRR